MEIKKISNLFSDNGIIIQGSNSLNLEKLNREKIINLFNKYGIIVFRDFKFNPRNVIKFTDLYTYRYANDARRREEKCVG